MAKLAVVVLVALVAAVMAFKLPVSKPVMMSLNMDAVKALPTQTKLNMDAVKALPTQTKLNMDAVNALPTQTKLNMDAVKAIRTQTTLNQAAVDALTQTQQTQLDLASLLLPGLPLNNATSGVTLTSFSFKDCGAAADAGHVSAFQLSPDPIVLPGTLSFSLQASLGANEPGPIKLVVSLKKRVGVWVSIPCVDNIGSCTYDDICVLLAKIPLGPDGKCPAPLPQYNVPCRCPLPVANWNIPTTSIKIPTIPSSIPAALLNGDYQAQIQAYGAQGQEVLCLEVEVTLKDNSQ